MKLIRCKIDNFGTLSAFSYAFSDGLNIIHAPNGFGKTTLAAFLKAMFYGFPRTGARNIVENERRRYAPWQGGSYGGWLEFEQGGSVYRITRQFGASASKDRFALWDVTRRCASDKFSDKIGEELFQLDAEAFARTLFLSAADHAGFSNGSIRARLSNLVDSTDDLNNYDTAVARLKQRRNELSSPRGNRGELQARAEQIARLEAEAFEAEEKQDRLAQLEAEIDEKNALLDQKTGEIRKLRGQIQAASVQEVLQSRQKQYRSLQQDAEICEGKLRALEAAYPAGFPSMEEINRQRECLTLWSQAARKLESLPPAEADRCSVEAEAPLFSDPEAVQRDLEACQGYSDEYEQLSARLHAQMLPEELRRLEQLSQRFQAGLPSREALQRCMEQADSLKAAELQLDALQKQLEPQPDYAALEAMFRAGEPSNEQIAACETMQQEIVGLEERKRALAFSPAEAADWEALSHSFASGVPGTDEIRQQRQSFRRIAELNGIQNKKTALIQAEGSAASSAASRTPAICVLLGVLLALAGIVLFVLQMSSLGAVLLGLGLSGLLCGFWLRMKAVEQAHGVAVTGSAITEAENRELDSRQRDLTAFLLRFYRDVGQPDETLTRLTLERERYLSLKSKQEAQAREADQIAQAIQSRRDALLRLFTRYYPGRPYWDGFPSDLMRKHNDYLHLRKQRAQQEAQCQQLAQEITDGRALLARFLANYGPEQQLGLRAGLQALDAEAREFQQLSDKKQHMMQGKRDLQDRAEALADAIRTTLTRYGAWSGSEPFAVCMQKLRKRFHDYQAAALRFQQYRKELEAAQATQSETKKELIAFFRRYALSGATPEQLLQQADEAARLHAAYAVRLQEAKNRLSDFLAEYPEQTLQVQEDSGTLPALEELQRTEQLLQREAEALQNELPVLRQERDALRRRVESLPELEDSIALCKEAQKQTAKNVELLEQALSFLETAKDAFAERYVGAVEQGFQRYAHALLGAPLGEPLLDKDLELYLEVHGKPREIGSFSAGTAEGIAICMRMALVEALYQQERPFLILDDPFVNLDDERSARALAMLRKLAEEYQILYLVCNSSRLDRAALAEESAP